MNFKRLMKAMAVIGLVSFGSQALATWDVVNSDDFEVYDLAAFEPQTSGTAWTADPDDASLIKSTDVSEFDASGAPIVGSSVESQVLELDTEGNELTFAAETSTRATVLVDMLVKMVGADEAPDMTGVDARTAVYLDTSDEEGPAVLKAFVTEGGANAWVALEGVAVEEGEWVSLKIEIDYETNYEESEPLVSFTVNGVLLEDASENSAFVAANLVASWSKEKITEVVFKGTGEVEDLFVREQEFSLETALVIRQTFVDGAVDGEDPAVEVLLTSSFNWSFNPELFGAGYDLTVVLLDSNEDFLVDLTSTGVVDPQWGLLEGSFDAADVITGGLLDGETYFVRGIYTEAAPTDDIVFDPQGANLVFEAVDLANGTISFTGAGEVLNLGPFTMYLIATEDLIDGDDFTIQVTVDATSDANEITGTATFAVVIDGYDTLFFKGLTTEAIAE